MPRAHGIRASFVGLASLACLFAACGGEPEPSEPAQTQSDSSGSEAAAEPKAGMNVSGLLGTIPARKVEDLMSSKLPALQRCFFDGAGEVEFIGGEFTFYARVGADGGVEYAYPKSSSVGHRATEQCLLAVVKRTRFPKPQGGDAAELAWGFEIDAQDGVRPPVQWSADRAADAVTRNRAELDACNLSGRYRVTAYVAQGGAVLAAGASTDSNDAATALDCLTSAVKAWTLPDPGSYAAKVSFDL